MGIEAIKYPHKWGWRELEMDSMCKCDNVQICQIKKVGS